MLGGSLAPQTPETVRTECHMSEPTTLPPIAETVARATPEAVARRVRGLSDRTLAWLFVSPTVILLLAINIFPLIWTVRLSLTNYRANRTTAAVRNVGFDNYAS